MKKPFLVILGLTSCAAVASAQTKTSLTGKCDPKTATSQVMEVGDRPKHTLGVVKNTCTASNATEMEGLKTRGYTYTATFDVTGTKVTQRGYAVVEMDNGDKAFVRFQGNATNKPDGSSDSDEGTWSYTGGTGKLKGIAGKGTYKGSVGADGYTSQIEGEYSIAAAKPAAKTKK